MTENSSRVKQGVHREELVNSITHGIGLILATAGLFFLIFNAEGYSLVALIIYGVTLVLLYLASTLYHMTTHMKVKSAFRIFDHVGIFLLIAGTYTPFCMIALKGRLGIILLVVVWLLAIGGLVLKIFFYGKV